MSSVVWADGPFSILPAWVLDSEVSDRAIRLFGILARHAQADGHGATPGRKRLAEKLRCSTSSVDRARDELIAVGAVTARERRREDGSRTTDEYILHASPREAPVVTGDEGGVVTGDEAKNESPVELERPRPLVRSEIQPIVDAWKVHSPPLIAHRDTYFASAKTCKAIEKSLRTYPADDVAAAVANYATVLGGSEYRWNHSWTIVDFLNRGLDKFVPEADPLNNFRVRVPVGPNMKYGRRDVSAGELLALSERLKSERLELESGEGRSLAP